MLIAADGLEPDETTEASDLLLERAERAAAAMLHDHPVEELPHIAAWRDAYRAFGAIPQRTRNSLESLTLRASGGLPRVNQLTNIYNAVSVLHQVPLGGEDLDRYDGPPRLVRADGTEIFDTVADGQPAFERPDTGEVVWRDDHGVTCRRWNWRQGTRTQLTDRTPSVLFILDAFDPFTDAQLTAAADELTHQLAGLGSDVVTTRRLISGAGHS